MLEGKRRRFAHCRLRWHQEVSFETCIEIVISPQRKFLLFFFLRLRPKALVFQVLLPFLLLFTSVLGYETFGIRDVCCVILLLDLP